MSEIIKQSMSNIWASAGDIVAPDAGKVSEGWLVEVVPRQYWNWMQNRTDVNLAYMLQHGIPEWDAITEFIANKSYVQHAGIVYKAILTGINQNPVTATTYWRVAFATSTAALEALKATTPATDKLPYFSSSSTATTTTITPLARTLLDDTTQGEMLTTVGAQPLDATLTAIAGVTTATNKLPYFSGVDTATVTDLSAFGRSLLDDVDAGTARATLGLGTIATQDANAVTISGGSITGITDLAIADGGTGASNAATARTNLGLGSASTATVTTSTTDTTAGRVLKVGDFGLGGSAAQIPVVDNIDYNPLINGTYATTPATLGTFPGVATYGIVQHVRGTNVDYGGQIFTPESNAPNAKYLRHLNNGVWTPWVEVATSANSLGHGQTWQDMIGSRSLGVTYTNSTGRPIQLAVHVATTTGYAGVIATVYSETVAIVQGDAGVSVRYDTLTLIVPNGATYGASLTGGSSAVMVKWMELR